MNEPEPLEPPKRPPHRARRGRWRAKLTRMDWLLDKLVQVEEAIELVLAMPKMNAAGLAALLARSASFRTDLERARAEIPDELAGATPAEIRTMLELQLADWPDDHLEVAFLVYGERRRGRILFIGEGGHKAEFDPMTGWEQTAADE